MTSLYFTCGAAQLVVGIIHSFVYGPMKGIALRGEQLWFYAGGGALMFAGAITMLAAWSRVQNGGLVVASALANLLLLVFTLLFAIDLRNAAIPQIAVLTLTAGGALIFASRDIAALLGQ